MNCNEATTLVDAYADGELDTLRRRTVEHHIERCASCAARHRRVVALRDHVHDEVPYFRASSELRARVSAMVGAMAAAQPPRPRATPRTWHWLTGGALAGCMATVLAWLLGTAVITAQVNDDVLTQAVAMHVQATLGERTIQVASSDRHTVKPWLSARLDYSPPVHDFADEGFALVGGRLDTMQQRSVATLVYGYRLHTIDVFVRPASNRSLPAEPRTVRGFNVACATGSGMEWVAVSDMDAQLLQRFVRELAQADGGT
jgi:anti-sigma factor RsiW